MDLYKRLIGYPYDTFENFQKIPLSPYIALCHRQIAGDCTRQQVIDWLTLVNDEPDDHDDIMARLEAGVNPLSRHELEDILMMVEQGFLWGTADALKTRLGIS